MVTGSGPLTIKNFTNGQFGIRLMDLANYGEATRTVFDRIHHYEQVGNNPDGSPILQPVYAPFFDDTANDTRPPITNISPIVPPIGGRNNLIHAGRERLCFTGTVTIKCMERMVQIKSLAWAETIGSMEDSTMTLSDRR